MKRERTTKEEEEGKTLLRLFGEGSYNCVYEIKNVEPPAVVTISVIPDADAERLSNMKKDTRKWLVEARGDRDDDHFVLLYRGRYMLTFLNRFKKQLGPSFVREIGSLRVFSNMEELAKKYNVKLCEKTLAQIGRYKRYHDESGYSLAMQTMEKLGPRWYGTKAEEIFSLLWFFSTSQLSFQFSHRDLSKGNVLTRKYDDPSQEFFFALTTAGGQTMNWKIKADVLPVVIDFDFASVKATRSIQDRDRVGTWEFAPPDAMIRTYLRELQDENPHVNILASLGIEKKSFQLDLISIVGYDLWSVGMIVLENLAPDAVPELRTTLLSASYGFRKLLRYKVQKIKKWKEAISKYHNDLVSNLFSNMILSCLVAEPTGGMPRFIDFADYGFRYPGFLFNFDPIVFEDENVLETIFTNESVVSFRRDFHENDDVFGKHRKLIQYLLRWDPQQRGYSTVLPEFSMQKGDIFYDFLSPPASSAILSTTTKYYSFQETRRSGLDAFTKEDVEALQKQIGQHNDSKNEKKKN